LALALRFSLSALAITPHHKNADQKVGILLLRDVGLAAYAQIAADQMLTLAIVLEPIG